MLKFEHICATLAARDCYFGGCEIPELAKEMKISQSALRERLKVSLDVSHWSTVERLRDSHWDSKAKQLRLQPEFFMEDRYPQQVLSRI